MFQDARVIVLFRPMLLLAVQDAVAVVQAHVNAVQDAVAAAGEADGIPVFKVKSWRLKGETRPEVSTLS